MSIINIDQYMTTTETDLTPFQSPELRYTVEKAYVTPLKGNPYPRYLILEDGIPDVYINKFLIKYLIARKDSSTSVVHNIAKFLNEMDEMGLSLSAIPLNEIYAYYEDLFVSAAKSYRSIIVELNYITALFEYLAKRNYPLDDSILRANSKAIIIKKNSKEQQKLTLLSLLKDEFLPRYEDANKYLSQSYTKWYTGPQIIAIDEELASAYRCIFDLTVYCGYRISTALSVLLSGIDFGQGFVRPTHSKTNMVHTSVVPAQVLEQLQMYMFDVRNEIVRRTGSTDPHFFLNSKGQPINYAAYNAALKAAALRVQAKFPELGLMDVHTHAGRSTYAAALRSYQLEQRRKGQETISDADFCLLMDWRTLGSLRNYDILTRTVEVSPLLSDFYSGFFGLASSNQIKILEPDRQNFKFKDEEEQDARHSVH